MSTQKQKKEELINFTINGRPVQALPGLTILDVARQYGFDIPTLCYHEAIEPTGSCRLCVVEVREGSWSKVVVSCMFPPYEGVEVLTDSPRVRNVRKWVLEMLLAEAPASGLIKKLAAEYGATSTRFEVKNPEEECLLCGMCVRVCDEVVGIRALSFGSRGTSKHIATPYMVPNKACIACGSCLTVCPTGAMKARFDQIRGDLSERTGHGHAH